MKHTLLLLLLVAGLSVYSSNAQNAPGNSGPTLNEKIIGKWIYEGEEQFGVLAPLDSTQKNDWIEFTSDMKYNRVLKGKTEKGNYKIAVSSRQVFLTDEDSKKTTMYKIKSATEANIVLDFQTPDLVHTLYHFKKVQ